ncbi:MAG: rhodanese-like domain-containing protein [Anaerolineales bacterium]|uniref:rhodanese-like domain-containing protein n=1 Tax=Candidatus Villigracilis affinis TaxID=3140682 RepID=UPI001DD66C4B|nr:rhodanese-like domain-containing protein [Anaerolineales bacterium]MBK9603917.1 rhodanese-like domain-containing protein [Anaerolineales bacterium]MBL0347391.1 rhodanese-like domain-containing protein [Anaerolineales bacterium]
MTRQRNIFIGLSVALLAVLACNAILPQSESNAPISTQAPIFTLSPLPTKSGQPQTEDEVPRVSVEDAKLALDSGEAVIVDVRSSEAYAEVHIAGAVLIPLGEFEGNIANVPLDKDQWIITYCT